MIFKKESGYVAVLCGGASREREISLTSGRAVCDALVSAGIRAELLDTGGDPEKALAGKQIEAAFIALHGTGGEDGVVQRLLERLGIPYTGSGALASANAFYKDRAKILFEQEGLPTPRYQVFQNSGEETKLSIDGPWVLKPVAEGSSIGVAMFDDRNLLLAALLERLVRGEVTLVEERILGRELTVGILGNRALPIIELVTSRPFYDFEAKYKPGFTQYLLPANLPAETSAAISYLALEAHRALGLQDLSRIDLMLNAAGEPFLLEANSIPGFTGQSLLPKAAKHIGIDFPTLCREILSRASLKARKGKKQGADWAAIKIDKVVYGET